MSNQETIEKLWDNKDQIDFINDQEAKNSVLDALNLLDKGQLRVCEKKDSEWHVNQWLKKAILLSFRIQDMELIDNGPTVKGGNTSWWDKVPSKFQNWTDVDFQNAGFRAVPNCVVRRSAFIAKSAVLMPCFVNLGAYVDEGTMVDTWATVGSCAQVGKNCHISGGAGIGGVLEPLQANPVIIEDNCFIGARSEVAEGVIVERVQFYPWEFLSVPRLKSSIERPGKYIWDQFLLTLLLCLAVCQAQKEMCLFTVLSL